MSVGRDHHTEPPQLAARPLPSTAAWAWVTEIPTGFPLGDGMGAEGSTAHVGEERPEAVFSSLVICGGEVWTPEVPRANDVLGASWSDGVEGGEQRTLALYPSSAAAQNALTEMQGAVLGCPDQTNGGGGYIQPIPLTGSAGDDSLAYVDQYGDSSGLTGPGNAYVVTRVGNALLLDKEYFGGAGSQELAQQEVERLEDRSAGVIAQMCVFSPAPC